VRASRHIDLLRADWLRSGSHSSWSAVRELHFVRCERSHCFARVHNSTSVWFLWYERGLRLIAILVAYSWLLQTVAQSTASRHWRKKNNKWISDVILTSIQPGMWRLTLGRGGSGWGAVATQRDVYFIVFASNCKIQFETILTKWYFQRYLSNILTTWLTKPYAPDFSILIDFLRSY